MDRSFGLEANIVLKFCFIQAFYGKVIELEHCNDDLVPLQWLP
jgi:hypothetical protein